MSESVLVVLGLSGRSWMSDGRSEPTMVQVGEADVRIAGILVGVALESGRLLSYVVELGGRWHLDVLSS